MVLEFTTYNLTIFPHKVSISFRGILNQLS